VKKLLSSHYEGQGNEKAWRSYHVCSATLIACTLHMGMFHGKYEIQFETSSFHELTILWHDSSFHPICYKYQMFCTHVVREIRFRVVSVSFLVVPGRSNSPFWASTRYTTRKINTGRTMETSQNMKKGTRSGRITKPEPQSDWDSFSLTTGIPKDKKGFFLYPGTMTSHCTELGVEGTMQEGRIVEALSPQQ
jgi:hypothetical protein